MDAFGDQSDCYHRKVSKNGKCQKCGADVPDKKKEDKK